jgi:Pyrimidine dimer DNA glycosylase
MNIFVVDLDPLQAARDLCDEHVGKMLLESTQMLATASILFGGPAPCRKDGEEYKICHPNHPCSKWVRASNGNWLWLAQHAVGLSDEFERRYGKRHACQTALEAIILHGSRPEEGDITPFALAMPDEFKDNDAVRAYRRFYIHDKKSFATWERSAPPAWWLEGTA